MKINRAFTCYALKILDLEMKVVKSGTLIVGYIYLEITFIRCERINTQLHSCFVFITYKLFILVFCSFISSTN